MKAYFEHNSNAYFPSWLKSLVTKVNTLEEAEVLILKGDAPVDPSIYMDKNIHKFTTKSRIDKNLDAKESALLKKAIQLEMLVIGIQRGSILTCIESGGDIIQYSGRSNSPTELITPLGKTKCFNFLNEVLNLTWMPKSKYVILAYSKHDGVLEKGNGESGIAKSEFSSFRVPEVVYFPETSCLSIASDIPSIHDLSFSPNMKYDKYLNKLVAQLYEEHKEKTLCINT